MCDRTFRPYEPEQPFLLPPTLQEWLPADHLAYFISDLVEALDLTAILSWYDKPPRLDPVRHALGGIRRDRCVEGTASRRGQRSGHAHVPRRRKCAPR